jgi:hypothetical protein
MRSSLLVCAILAMAACKRSEPPPQQAGARTVAAPAPAGLSAPTTVRGKVLERIDAAPYSYLRLATATGEVWTAVPQTSVGNGSDVAIEGAMPMDGFESKSLKRKFDKIYFGQLGGGTPGPSGPAAAAAPASAPKGAMLEAIPPGVAAAHAAAAAGPSAAVGDVKVPKAEGADARTVAEVWTQKAALKEKRVAVRGKVVKFSAGIMGRNWVHLRDGSGSQGKGDNDITVTTRDNAEVGEVVVARGTVRLDKDFGAGYAYPVIIEDAKVAK